MRVQPYSRGLGRTQKVEDGRREVLAAHRAMDVRDAALAFCDDVLVKRDGLQLGDVAALRLGAIADAHSVLGAGARQRRRVDHQRST
eukprot:6188135-Pleurochrysis_carterae.AAC.9